MQNIKQQSLKEIIGSKKFYWANSDINETNFPKEEIGEGEIKLFHFNRLISSEDAIKEMDKAGNSSTIGQALIPQYKKSIESGEQKGFNLLGDGK